MKVSRICQIIRNLILIPSLLWKRRLSDIACSKSTHCIRLHFDKSFARSTWIKNNAQNYWNSLRNRIVLRFTAITSWQACAIRTEATDTICMAAELSFVRHLKFIRSIAAKHRFSKRRNFLAFSTCWQLGKLTDFKTVEPSVIRGCCARVRACVCVCTSVCMWCSMHT